MGGSSLLIDFAPVYSVQRDQLFLYNKEICHASKTMSNLFPRGIFSGVVVLKTMLNLKVIVRLSSNI